MSANPFSFGLEGLNRIGVNLSGLPKRSLHMPGAISFKLIPSLICCLDSMFPSFMSDIFVDATARPEVEINVKTIVATIPLKILIPRIRILLE